MKYQFEGFADGDVVTVTGYGVLKETITGELQEMELHNPGSLDELVQVNLLTTGRLFSYELLESGPATLSVFGFETIEKVKQ